MTRALLLAVALGGLASCGGGRRVMPRVQTRPPAGVVQLRAGIAQVDITPPVGLGLFGHGPEARIATGTQLRLRCQIFVIEAAAPPGSGRAGDVIALVPCDLAAPSLLLQREIARVAQARGAPLGADRILLMATHTHAAPAHYFAVENYTGPFSSRLVGFDPKVLHFLAGRIGHGVQQAYARRTAVRLGWKQAAVDPPLSRNRSLNALYRNRDLPAWLAQRLAAAGSDPAAQAVDPTLSVLRIDRRLADGSGYVPYGIFAVYGVHPTLLPNTNSLYSGDLFGYAARAVARRFAEHGVVVGLANGIEGDVMAARAATGAREVRRLGEQLAAEIDALWDAIGESGALDGDARMQVAYRELVFANARVGGAESGEQRLCEHPQLGTPSGGGASDHPTALRVFPQYNAGVALKEPDGCHGRKLPIQMLDGQADAGVDFPGLAPITVVELGDHALVALPAEVTTVTGARIRDAVADALDPAGASDAIGRGVVVAGLTNEYLQYVATADEYDVQLYEGASTLYGPLSAEFLVRQTRCLAAGLRQPAGDAACRDGQPFAVDAVHAVGYPRLAERTFMERDERKPVSPARELGAPERFLTADGLAAFRARFRGPEPARVDRPDELRVEIRQLVPGEPPVLVDDHTGTSLETRFDFTAGEWIVGWVPSFAGVSCGGRFELLVAAGEQQPEPLRRELAYECPVPAAAQVTP